MSERARREVGRVIVVGAGVSGCACAASLASAGAQVTLVNPALDRVGESSYEVELAGEDRGLEDVEQALAELPEGVAAAWRGAILVSDDGTVVVDRRLLSIRMKKALEDMPGVEMRQGLVSGLGVGDTREPLRGGVCVMTAFGEELRGDAVVLALGLSLGGSVVMGASEVGAGRYGQPSSEGVKKALEDLGAQLVPVEFRVGARFHVEREGLSASLSGAEVEERARGKEGAGDEDGLGPEEVSLRRLVEAPVVKGEGPPSPYEDAGLWRRSGLGVSGRHGETVGVAWPDGLVTGEMAVAQRLDDAGMQETLGRLGREGRTVIARPEYVVRASVVADLEEGGLLPGLAAPGGSLWVTGRAGGAREHIESLRAGSCTGRMVADCLGCGG